MGNCNGLISKWWNGKIYYERSLWWADEKNLQRVDQHMIQTAVEKNEKSRSKAQNKYGNRLYLDAYNSNTNYKKK